jgi:CMP-N-acetylneuraminic acid synthetase
MFVDILFQEAHPLYQAAFLRNQISCTLATLFAVSAMDTAISLSETDPLTEYQSVLDACQECISSCRHSLISVVETSKDTGEKMNNYIVLSTSFN